ncbi:hypothetical protein INR49_012365 [Caranx melampygus]|nr:hypothetical protein INR49_012365 [Caranx melampygus]
MVPSSRIAGFAASEICVDNGRLQLGQVPLVHAVVAHQLAPTRHGPDPVNWPEKCTVKAPSPQ